MPKKMEILTVKESYPNGVCPDCSTKIPVDAPDGWTCPNCGHACYNSYVPLTKKQKKEYLKHPSLCPHCGSDNLHSDHIEADSKTAWSNVVCMACNEQWKDVYTLTSIESIT